MKDLITTAGDVQLYCEEQEWKFCFIGDLALQFWGEQRVTKDVNLTVLTGFGNEESFIERLLEKFPSRIEDA